VIHPELRERLFDAMTEQDLQDVVIDMAHMFGWKVAHFRPARTEHGWTTPVAADGAGFPDLCLARRGQVMFVELKTVTGRIRPQQQAWLDQLSDAHLIRPTDLDVLQELLR
jgi:hypothetical protein